MSLVVGPQDPNKRKRDGDDTGRRPSSHCDTRIPQPPPPQTADPSRINYNCRLPMGKLDLIPGDSETFSDVLGLIHNYEGVLDRHESLAASLGAKLTGPRLLRALENAFEGPIVTSPPTTPLGQEPVGWSDVVSFAKAYPDQFVPTTNRRGERARQFFLRGVKVQILEDDWRLIMNGSLERLSEAGSAPLEEDEAAELATLDIVTERLQILIKKADEVAKHARQLNYHLSGRKAALSSKHAPPGAGFAVPDHQSAQRQARPNIAYDIHADLLQQFNPNMQFQPFVPMQPLARSRFEVLPHLNVPIHHEVMEHFPPAPLHGPPPPPARLSPMPPFLRHGEPLYDRSIAHKYTIASRLDKIGKGDAITPPCDRCRRLQAPCIKHLTACQGCTRKHAKCSWNTVSDDDIARLEREGSSIGEPVANGPCGSAGSGNSTGPRYDIVHDDRRAGTDDSIGTHHALQDPSRPTSRGSRHVASQPLSPIGLGSKRHPRPSIETDTGDPPPAPRLWPKEPPRLHVGLPEPPQDLSLQGHAASALRATGEVHGAGVNVSEPERPAEGDAGRT